MTETNRRDVKTGFILLLQPRNIPNTKHTYIRVKGWKRIYQANGPKKQSSVPILISDQIDFETKPNRIDKEGHDMLITENIHQGDTAILHIYAINTSVIKFLKEIWLQLKSHIDLHTLIMGNSTPHSHQ